MSGRTSRTDRTVQTDRIFVALVRLERPGGGFVEAGQLCQWERGRGRALLELGLVRRVTLAELAAGTQAVLRCDQRGAETEAEQEELRTLARSETGQSGGELSGRAGERESGGDA